MLHPIVLVNFYTSECRWRSAGDHCVHKYMDCRNLSTGDLANDIADFIDDRIRQRCDVDAVLYNNVQINGKRVILIVVHQNALAHGLLAEQMDQSVGH